MSAIRRAGGTVVTSCDSACAICARRLSFGVVPYTSLQPGFAAPFRASSASSACLQRQQSRFVVARAISALAALSFGVALKTSLRKENLQLAKECAQGNTARRLTLAQLEDCQA